MPSTKTQFLYYFEGKKMCFSKKENDEMRQKGVQGRVKTV